MTDNEVAELKAQSRARELARSRTFLFVDNDPDKFLVKLSKLKYIYIEYVIEIASEGSRIRGVIRFKNARSPRTLRIRLCNDVYAKPVLTEFKHIWRSFEQAHNRHTVLLKVQNGDRPQQGNRTDLICDTN